MSIKLVIKPVVQELASFPARVLIINSVTKKLPHRHHGENPSSCTQTGIIVFNLLLTYDQATIKKLIFIIVKVIFL